METKTIKVKGLSRTRFITNLMTLDMNIVPQVYYDFGELVITFPTHFEETIKLAIKKTKI